MARHQGDHGLEPPIALAPGAIELSSGIGDARQRLDARDCGTGVGHEPGAQTAGSFLELMSGAVEWRATALSGCIDDADRPQAVGNALREPNVAAE